MACLCRPYCAALITTGSPGALSTPTVGPLPVVVMVVATEADEPTFNQPIVGITSQYTVSFRGVPLQSIAHTHITTHELRSGGMHVCVVCVRSRKM